jgi:hypothetical protein
LKHDEIRREISSMECRLRQRVRETRFGRIERRRRRCSVEALETRRLLNAAMVSVADQFQPALVVPVPSSELTSTTLTASATRSTYGQPLSFAATVAPAGAGAATPTGMVQFFVDNASADSPVRLINGVAVDAAIVLDAGVHTIAATYLGAPVSVGSASNRVVETVAPAPLVVTASNVTRAVAQANPGFSVTIGGFVLNQETSDLGGNLSFTTTATAASPAGTYPIVPGGFISTNYAITYRTGTLIVTPAVTSDVGVTITTAPDALPHAFGTALTFTATVTGTQAGGPTPTGTIQFAIDGVTFGGPVVLVNGAATSAPSATLVPGTHAVSAAYSGDVNFPARGSSNAAVVIAPTSNSVIVDVLCRQLLGHSPDPAALALWTNALDSGVTAAKVARKIALSTERRTLEREHLAKSNLRRALAAALRASQQFPQGITGLATSKFAGFVS